jgi:hypothetical protein
MKKRNFLKLLLLLPLSTLYADKKSRLYHKGHYHHSQKLSFKSSRPYAYIEVTVLSGKVALSHTTLQSNDQLIVPYKEVELHVIHHASFVVKEIWS